MSEFSLEGNTQKTPEPGQGNAEIPQAEVSTRDRLLDLADRVEELNPKEFGMGCVRSWCGTVGCVVGWFPKFYPEAFAWGENMRSVENRNGREWAGYDDEAAMFLKIPFRDAAELFGSTGGIKGVFHHPHGATPKTVAKNIRKYADYAYPAPSTALAQVDSLLTEQSASVAERQTENSSGSHTEKGGK